jgi:large subunit ribosomal protein L20
MARVKGGPRARRRHKKILKRAKGHYGRRKNTIRMGNQSVEAAGEYAYMHRRSKKRDFRSLWITRINAAARIHGLKYSQFMHGLKVAGIDLDRKVLADIAVRDAEGFAAIAKQVQGALKKSA